MSLVLLTILIVALACIMEVAAIALKLTGMDIRVARFQALSALTSTGFTTKEAENMVVHPMRRNITMGLMVIGHIGLAVIILTLFGGVGRSVSPWSIVITFIIIIVIYRVISDKWLLRKLDQYIEYHLSIRVDLGKRTVEEVLRLNDDYVVAEITVDKNSLLLNQSLASLHLLDNRVMVLAIARRDMTIHAPKGDDQILADDRLVVYGESEAIEALASSQSKDMGN